MNAEYLPLDQTLHGDCLEMLARFQERSVDMIFADPPYNLQLRQTLWRPDMSQVDGVDDSWDQFGSFAEYDAFTHEWLTACRRVLKDNGTIWVIGTYHNIFRVGAILQDIGFWVLNDITWIKTNPMPNFRGVRFTNAQETLIWAQKKHGEPYTFNHYAMKALNDDLQMRSDWYLPICTGKERIKVNGEKAHTTQKPEALLYRVILASTKPGDIVLDPFFGVGTTGAVAKKLNRHWIGIEKDPGYVQVAQQRIDAIPAPDPALADQIYSLNERRQRRRIPFGSLLERGMLQPGQHLYFGKEGTLTAIILPDGHLRLGELTGSIHQIGKHILNAPCNGWDHWYYIEQTSGLREPIDQLRQLVREEMGE
jgi:DNA modification methylase